MKALKVLGIIALVLALVGVLMLTGDFKIKLLWVTLPDGTGQFFRDCSVELILRVIRCRMILCSLGENNSPTRALMQSFVLGVMVPMAVQSMVRLSSTRRYFTVREVSTELNPVPRKGVDGLSISSTFS